MDGGPAMMKRFSMLATVLLALQTLGVGVAEAHHTAAPHSWYVWDVELDPARPATVYASTDNGVYRSTDSGGSWVQKSAGLRTLATKDLEVAAGGTLFLGASVGLYTSTNGGDTWTHLSSACTMTDGCPDSWAIAAAPDAAETVYAGTRHHGVLKTTDGGATWQAGIGLPRELVLGLAVHPRAPATIFASGPFGVFKSTDAGRTWVSSSVGIVLKPGHSVKTLTLDPRDPDVLLAGLTEGGVYRSEDGGRTWGFLAHPCDPITYRCDNHIEALERDPVNPTTLYAGTLYGSLYRSTDSGATWYLRTSGIQGGWVKSIRVDPTRPSTVYAGTYGGGMFKTTNAASSWAAANKGLT